MVFHMRHTLPLGVTHVASRHIKEPGNGARCATRPISRVAWLVAAVIALACGTAMAAGATNDGAASAAATNAGQANAGQTTWDISTWRLTTVSGVPAVISPAMQVDVSGLGWLTVSAKSTDSATGVVYWTGAKSGGRKAWVFHMRPDGVTRTYSVKLSASDDWSGQVRTLGFGAPKGKTVSFFTAALVPKPTAPAELEPTFFGLRDLANRAGTDCVLRASVRNIGGTACAGLTLTANVGGTQLAPQKLNSLDIGETAAVDWPVRMPTPGSYAATLRVTGAKVAEAVQSASVEFTARQLPDTSAAAVVTGAVPAGGVPAKPYVPLPQKVTGDYDIGVYYFPGWPTYSKWSVLDDFPERRPALGYYREGDPEVADWQLKWAAEHGVSFFIYDWYWEKGGRQLEHALHDGYMNSRYHTDVKFALLWANHNQPGTSSEQDLLDVTQYWIDNYFRRADYYTANGKPVIVIFSPERLTQDMGSAKVKVAIGKMRALVKQAGIPDMYLMACTGPDPASLKTLKAEGYDAATGYNYASAGSTNPLDASYDLAVTGYDSIWKQIADTKSIDYVPVADPGWDSRPWAGEQALVRTDRTPEKFKVMLEKAKTFADTHTVADRPKMVFVEAWNEFGEGAAIEPARGFGFGYLDALRSVFTSAPAVHTDLVPADVGMGPYDLAPPPAGFVWDFAVPGAGTLDFAPQNMGSYGAKGGALVGVASGSDPAVYSPRFRLDSASRSTVTVTMSVSDGYGAQVFWSTTDHIISEETSCRFDVVADGQYHTYTIEVGDSSEWKGTVTQLRLDPTDAAGAKIAVKYLGVN